MDHNEESQAENKRGEPCTCFSIPFENLTQVLDLGMDEIYGEVSVWVCHRCGQIWLKYLYEMEAFTHSGSWYLGALPQEIQEVNAQDVRPILEKLAGYFYGGSYFAGKTGWSSGKIYLP